MIADVTTLHQVELGVLGPLQVRQGGAPVSIPGAKPRAILTMLGLHSGSVVAADTLVELLWGEDPPRTAAKALQTHISSLRRALGDGFVLTAGAGWTLAEAEVDAARYKAAARQGRDAATAGDVSQAVARFEEALALWRGLPELPDGRRGASEKTRWIEGHAALVEDRADALLATGRAAEIVGELEAAVADAPLRERRWGQLMLALYRAGRQGEALGAYQRARALLAEELGVDPGPDLRRLEASVVAQDSALEIPAAQQVSSVTRAVTFLLTDIEGSTAAWEADADAMAVALARHDELVEQVVTSRGGRLIKTRGEGDATFSVFERPSAAAAAAIELQDAIVHEPWALREPMRVRVALHTGEVEFRDGDYFGRAVNRAARLRSLAAGGQILCSGATAELVIDSLADDVVLADLGSRQLRNLARPEHVFELRLQITDEPAQAVPPEAPLKRPSLPAVLAGRGPFVGREDELERLSTAWHTSVAGGTNAMLIAGEPGVGKTRLAGEWCRHAYDEGALVIYGRCDEDLGAPYQPFAEALRSLVPCLGAGALRGLRGVEALLTLVPGLTDLVPDLAAPTRADPDTERYALFDAVVALLAMASASAPVVLVLDDLHWAAKPTLLLLRHLLRFGEHARMQIIGTYRSTDLDRSHPLAAMLADLHRDGTANRLGLSGLDEDDVTAYVAEAGYNDEELARALASVTGGNPFFLIEALRHVDESGGRWDQSTLPQGVREAVSRRLSRLPAEANKALAAAAVVGSRFALELVERVVGDDLVDAFDEACRAGIVIEDPGGRYRFNHAIVRQSLLAELPSVRRMRLHQRIATTLEGEPGAEEELLAELAYHYFECAWAGNAAKAVEYCRRAADQAMTRLAYEGAADLYDRALHALEEIDEELPDRDDQTAELLVARCEALLAAGDVTSAADAVSQLQSVPIDSARIAAWATCFDGQLSMLIHPERLDEVESAVGAAAARLAELGDAAGEAKAHTVRAGCLARLGRIGDCEIALDDALTAARRAREHRWVNAVLANAPLAALWGPNPVPRAGGRCLDVVRLLRITTDSPAVEATSTRCQAVLEAFRGRGAAARRMIDSARRTVTELGLRHALSEVEQFAGIVELVADEPAAAEAHLRKAYNGFRRMGLDADTAETAALLGRACLALERDAEADELCAESERLAGHALKASIAWRTLRARLLTRRGDHDEARRVAEEAVALAQRTDALVDHGDACVTLATVLGSAGDVAGARAAAERAVDLYERKGAVALAERARTVIGAEPSPAPDQPQAPPAELDNACVRAIFRLDETAARGAWNELEVVFAPNISVESRRKIVGLSRIDLSPAEWVAEAKRFLATGVVRCRRVIIGVRGDRLALVRTLLGTADASPGAPEDELLHLMGIDVEGRIASQMSFDVEDLDAALAELDAAHARFEAQRPIPRRLENKAARVFEDEWSHFAARDWDALADLVADDYVGIDHRRVVSAETQRSRMAVVRDLQAAAEVGFSISMVSAIATRGDRLVLARVRAAGQDSGAIQNDALNVVEIDADDRIANVDTYDLEDIDAAFGELDRRYLVGDAAPYSRPWSLVTEAFAALNQRRIPETTPGWASIDHRRLAPIGAGDLGAYLLAAWELSPQSRIYIEAVHRLSSLGAVITHVAIGTSPDGFDAEWRVTDVVIFEGDRISRSELFDDSDVTAALARFDELSGPVSRPENAATQLRERLQACFAARDWDAMSEILAADISTDDRRRAVNAGAREGRSAVLNEMLATVEIGVESLTADVIATRGDRLALCRTQTWGRDKRPEAFHTDVFDVFELDADGRVSARVVFDRDDFDAAMAELDSRYLAGEAAAYARTWSAIAQSFASINRREMPATTTDWVNIDHRRGTSIAPGEMAALMDAAWNSRSDLGCFIESVHRLNDRGVVITHVAHETSGEGFHAEWRVISVITVEGDLINRTEVFDEAARDAALARYEELGRPVPGLENAATRAYDRIFAWFAARDWDAMAGIVAEGFSSEDRRRVVNAGVRHGRDAGIDDVRAIADVGFTLTMVGVMATRGGRLALLRVRAAGPDPVEIRNDALNLVEVDADERIVASVVFDLDDFEAALTELDARYLAGEAATNSHAWSIVVNSYAALNRREPPLTAPGCVYADHRRETAFGPGDLTAYFGAGWASDQDINVYVEQVHRLNARGAVVTYAAQETSAEGFAAEWRGIAVLIVVGGLVNRCEVFDEAELDTALARFDQLNRPTRRLENAASQVYDRLAGYFTAGDWPSMSKTLAHNMVDDDRRHMVNAGTRRGRDIQIANGQAAVQVGADKLTSTVIATRGRQLALCRSSIFGRDEQPGAFRIEFLSVVEIDVDEQLVAHIAFDLDNSEAALAELDARYLAGEAAPYAHTWSVIAKAYAAVNRHELPPTTPGWTNIDHRRGIAFAPGNLDAYLEASWDLFAPGLNVYIETVLRLTELGAVVTRVVEGTSSDGFQAEWREIGISTVEGDLINRSEIFDETELDAALARFGELQARPHRLDNAASQVNERFWSGLTTRDWPAMAEILAEDVVSHDNRRVVNSGELRGRDTNLANLRAVADVGFEGVVSTILAIRGQRLALSHIRSSAHGLEPGEISADMFGVVEIDRDSRMIVHSIFDADDFDAALAELDARYLAGEAAAHAHTWSVLTRAHVSFNRGELPPTDWVMIDHRRGTPFTFDNPISTISAKWDLTPDLTIHVEAVHRLSNIGAVVTHTQRGTSPEGLNAEWRMLQVLTVDGDRVDRCELFDEADLDAALARFEELRPQVPRLENAAGRILERYQACFAAPDWAAMSELLADDIVLDDRRRVVNAGIRRGRDVHIADTRAALDVGADTISLSVIATRGERLALAHVRAFNSGSPPGEVGAEWCGVVETDAGDRIIAMVSFDLGDIDAAYEELDARYLAGEAAPHAHTWSVIAALYAGFNRQELPAVDWVIADHRRATPSASGELSPALETFFDLTPEFRVIIETVHRIDSVGAVVTIDSHGLSQDGLGVEWRMIQLLVLEGNRLTRCEFFDESDLDTAIARFDQLGRLAPQLQNVASRVLEQFLAHFAAQAWDAMADLIAEDFCSEDRRSVINAGIRRGRDVEMANWRATAEVWMSDVQAAIIATRGERLALFRFTFASQDSLPEAFQAAALGVIEVNADNRFASTVVFDPDDIDDAFEELDVRYIAGEAAAHAHTWPVITRAYSAANRNELPARTPDWVNVDHRRGRAFGPGELETYMRSTWDVIRDTRIYIESVHRLSDLGALVTHAVRGTSRDGFDAEWREVSLSMVDGDRFNRTELFDETDLNVALARFDELHRQRPWLENPVNQRFLAYFAARDWDATAQVFAEDYSLDDRRRVVNAGVRQGRDAAIEDLRVSADVGLLANLASEIVATRGERLVLTRVQASGRDHPAIQLDVLQVVEHNGEQVMAAVLFDPEEIDSAFGELDARYVAGEAAPHAHTWSVIARSYSESNRHELPCMTQDSICIDHRAALTAEREDLAEYLRSLWDLMPDTRAHIEAVHRLSDLGAVVTHAARGTSQEGFDAEWRVILVGIVEGDLLSRAEVFDEADLDAALARFEELHAQASRLENAASRAEDRLFAHAMARDWAAMADVLAGDSFVDDRRRVVNIGVWDGCDVVVANMQALAEGLARVSLTVIATRGERLALSLIRSFNPDLERGEFAVEMLGIAEINADGRIAAHVLIDADDLDAAFEELETRYLAGEAAAHAHTWSVIAASYAAMNRRELFPTTSDWVNIDHRRPGIIEEGGLNASLISLWQLTANTTFRVEAVHRLTDLGAVCSHVAHGVSHQGFDAEWRGIEVQTVDGDLISRCEIFDAADIDAALARFDQLTAGE
ncbi:regulator [Mycobacterium scrofulaceum]|uniref:Regulator n=1 Tax=Mycobacterium scrofulaceum TaxID=1783 RepID=A0A1X0KCR9_MYCSC|nr:regulator [Mycobacterium scrofulaceum]